MNGLKKVMLLWLFGVLLGLGLSGKSFAMDGSNPVNLNDNCAVIIRGEEPDKEKAFFLSEARRFVEALRTKDLPTFVSFLRPDVEIFAALPEKEPITDYKKYLESQDHWFHGTTGTFSYRVEKAYQSGCFGLLNIRATYQNVGEGNIPFKFDLVISFGFRKIDGKWIKTFSQNSVVSKKTGAEALQ